MTLQDFKRFLVQYIMKCKDSEKQRTYLEINARFIALLNVVSETILCEDPDIEVSHLRSVHACLEEFMSVLLPPYGHESLDFETPVLWLDLGVPTWEKNFTSLVNSQLGFFYDVMWHYCCMIEHVALNRDDELVESENLRLYRDCKTFQSAVEAMAENEVAT